MQLVTATIITNVRLTEWELAEGLSLDLFARTRLTDERSSYNGL